MGRTRSSHTESHFGSHQEYRRAAKPDIMKYLVVLSVVAACAYAQVGHSGIISPDGKNTQFSHDFAAGIAVTGPSGIVSTAGNRQLSAGEATLHNGRKKRPPQHLVGPSGAVTADGQLVQFTTGGTQVLLDGPSGIVFDDGQLVQKRAKRSTFGITSLAQVGAAQAMLPNGTPVHFAPGAEVAAAGPSGIVLTDGRNIQYSRKKRSTFGIIHGAQVGAAQAMLPNGTPVHFAPGAEVAAAGPSGIVLTDGRNIQYSRKKRSTSGIVLTDGRNIQYSR